MKRCPKCSRTFPDENQKFCTFDGGLLIHDNPSPVDPNLTVRTTSEDLEFPAGFVDASEAPTSAPLPDMAATITSFGNTTVRETPAIPTGTPTRSDLVAPAMRAPTADVSPPVQPTSQPLAQPAAPPKKRSFVPWIIGGLLVLLLFGSGAVAALFFLVIKPQLEARNERPVITEAPPATNENSNANTSTANENSATNANANVETKKAPDLFVPPDGAIEFANSRTNLDGKLAEHYVDFSFYYPDRWTKDPKSGVAGVSNFAKVERLLTDNTGEYMQERVVVSWYPSNGTFNADLSIFPERAQEFSKQISGELSGYEKVSEGETKVNSLQGYEFRFQGVFKNTTKGDLPYWGCVIFLPPGNDSEKNGVKIIMLATSLAPGVRGADDVGVKGELPLVLDSFRFGANR